MAQCSSYATAPLPSCTRCHHPSAWLPFAQQESQSCAQTLSRATGKLKSSLAAAHPGTGAGARRPQCARQECVPVTLRTIGPMTRCKAFVTFYKSEIQRTQYRHSDANNCHTTHPTSKVDLGHQLRQAQHLAPCNVGIRAKRTMIALLLAEVIQGSLAFLLKEIITTRPTGKIDLGPF